MAGVRRRSILREVFPQPIREAAAELLSPPLGTMRTIVALQLGPKQAPSALRRSPSASGDPRSNQHDDK